MLFMISAAWQYLRILRMPAGNPPTHFDDLKPCPANSMLKLNAKS